MACLHFRGLTARNETSRPTDLSKDLHPSPTKSRHLVAGGFCTRRSGASGLDPTISRDSRKNTDTDPFPPRTPWFLPGPALSSRFWTMKTRPRTRNRLIRYRAPTCSGIDTTSSCRTPHPGLWPGAHLDMSRWKKLSWNFGRGCAKIVIVDTYILPSTGSELGMASDRLTKKIPLDLDKIQGGMLVMCPTICDSACPRAYAKQDVNTIYIFRLQKIAPWGW